MVHCSLFTVSLRSGGCTGGRALKEEDGKIYFCLNEDDDDDLFFFRSFHFIVVTFLRAFTADPIAHPHTRLPPGNLHLDICLES